MKKYFTLLKLQVGMVSAYRFDLIFSWMGRFVMIFVYYALWNLTSTDKTQSIKLLQYYTLFYLIIESFSTARLGRFLSNGILKGDINSFLIRPINYPVTLFLKLLTVIIIKLLVPLIIFFIALIIFPDTFMPAGILNFFLFFVFIILGFISWNFFVLSLGSISFWGTEVKGLQSVIDLILNLVRGAWVPYYLFPEGVKNILSLTPIAYWGAYPIQIYQNPLVFNDVIKGMAIAVLWILILFAIFYYIYHKGLKNYEAVNG